VYIKVAENPPENVVENGIKSCILVVCRAAGGVCISTDAYPLPECSASHLEGGRRSSAIEPSCQPRSLGPFRSYVEMARWRDVHWPM
jgi:hypothetical protein